MSDSILPQLAHDTGVIGRRFHIFAYRDPTGRILVTARLCELKKRFHHIEKAYFTRWRRFAEEGPEKMKGDHYHKWDGDGLAHFKDLESKTRIPFFYDGARILIMTHVIEGKKENDLANSDVSETLRIRGEYILRKAEFERRIERAPQRRRGPR